MYWRDMTETEYATLPEARLAGALRWMAIACAIVAIVPTAGVGFAFVVLSTGDIHANPFNALSWLDGPARLGKVYMFPVVAWAWVVLIMTVLRLGATPIVASAGLIAWVLLRALVSWIGQAPAIAAAEQTSILDALVLTWPYATAIVAEISMVAGFCGYMATGMRPNAYYRRRLPVS
jgi:hypothetical protein